MRFFRLVLAAVLAFFIGIGPAFCQDLVPERIILNVTDSPATSQAVTWRTAEPSENAGAQLAVASDYADLEEEALTVKARSEQVAIGAGASAYHHSVRFEELDPATLYAYRVGDGKVWSEWSHFRTAADEAAPFRFIYLGDPQNDLKSYCSRILRSAYAGAPDAAFLMIAGDLVSRSGLDDWWGEFFYAGGWILGTMPSLMVPGNHEYPRDEQGGRSRSLTHLWRPHFTLPENGPEGLEETAYVVDYQDVRFVMIDGSDRLDEQAAWLDRVLGGHSNRWTVAVMHQPVYSTGQERDDPKRRDLLRPLFDRHKVDLVLQGHDHTYGRSHPLREDRLAGAGEHGTIYVVSTSGPKTYALNPHWEELMVKMSTGLQLYQVITVDGNRLSYESRTVTGSLHDAFELTKTPAQ